MLGTSLQALAQHTAPSTEHRARSTFDEPTTVAVANGAFYFKANPQLCAFANHKIWPKERLKDLAVLRIAL